MKQTDEEIATDIVEGVAEKHGLWCVLNGLLKEYSEDEVTEAITAIQDKQPAKFGHVWWSAQDVLDLRVGEEGKLVSEIGITKEEAEEILGNCDDALMETAIQASWETMFGATLEYLEEEKSELYKKLFPGEE